MDPLLEQFLSEARENLAFIDQNIEEIGGDDPELLNSVFRAAHTLKGGSGIVGFESIKEITHHAEDLLDMLRAEKIEFADGMTDALYNAFDEVMNLVEAAEESGEIVDSDAETVDNIVKELNIQMGKDKVVEDEWKVPFLLATNVEEMINYPLRTLRGLNSIKLPFVNKELNETFCNNSNFYAVLFDVDDSCMVYGNDPVYTLSLLSEKVLGVFSCMSNENAKAILSGEDEDGLILKTHIVAYIHATYEEIEDALFNFIDEIHLLPLDISQMLTLDAGDSGVEIDSLKELKDIAEDLDLVGITDEVERSLSLLGKDTLQYHQLERFLDIVGFINPEDTTKLASFFDNLYKGNIYSPSQIAVVEDIQKETIQESPEEEKSSSSTLEIDEVTHSVLMGILEQQQKALNYIETDDDFLRVVSMMDKVRKFIPNMPESFNSKEEIVSFIEDTISNKDENVTSVVEEKQEKSPEVVDVVKVEEKKIEQSKPVEIEIVEPKVLVPTKPKKTVKKSSSKQDEKKHIVGKTVKVDQESIDSLMNVAGELLVAKNSLPYLADNVSDMTHDIIKREIMEKYIFINRLTEQLQDLIMGMRMLPISYVFDRYPKLVRDIAKKLGKKVKLEVSGGETKLDKNMIEMLADPMIHIMRNSLDHGIESPDVREQKGKEASGTVTLNAYAQSDRIIIEIIDDGAGINTERVAGKVLEKGLLTPEQIDAMSEDEKAELVLLPGLSTAEEITEFSGRGVGMDVVKKSIESFGGSINIKTKANQGTTITLAIPMSLAVTSLLHIQMNDIHYGIPMDSVSETVKLEHSEIEYLHNEPFVYIRGEVIPLLFIKSMLDEKTDESEPLSIVVLNIKDNLLAVVVNKFLGQLDVVQKPLTGIMEGHPLFSGTALLGNGQIIMAIDPLGLLSISEKLKKKIII